MKAAHKKQELAVSAGRNGRGRCHRKVGLGRLRDKFHGITQGPPGVQAAGQGPHALKTFLLEPERHTGARRLVWSSTVQDDFAVARNLLVAVIEVLGVEMRGAGDDKRMHPEIHVVAQVDDRR
jgi:hypothetical protein